MSRAAPRRIAELPGSRPSTENRCDKAEPGDGDRLPGLTVTATQPVPSRSPRRCVSVYGRFGFGSDPALYYGKVPPRYSQRLTRSGSASKGEVT